MKKRLLPVLLAGAMALGCASFAMAEEEDLDELLSQLENVEFTEETVTWTTIDWSDFEEIAKADEVLSKGDFVEEESIGIKFYLPELMEEVELDEEDKENGILRFFWDGEAATFHITVTEDVEVEDVKEYEQAIQDAGYETMLVNVNGLEGVLYSIEADEETSAIMSLAYIPEGENTVIDFSCSPADEDSEYADLFRVIFASIQKIDE